MSAKFPRHSDEEKRQETSSFFSLWGHKNKSDSNETAERDKPVTPSFLLDEANLPEEKHPSEPPAVRPQRAETKAPKEAVNANAGRTLSAAPLEAGGSAAAAPSADVQTEAQVRRPDHWAAGLRETESESPAAAGRPESAERPDVQHTGTFSGPETAAEETAADQRSGPGPEDKASAEQPGENEKARSVMNFDEYKQSRAEETEQPKVEAEGAFTQSAAETAAREKEQAAAAAPSAKPAKKEKKGLKQKFSQAGRSVSRAWRVLGIVVAVLVLSFTIIGVIATVGFVKQAIGQMDTPKEAGETLIRVLKEDDFAGYQKLLANEEVKANDKALFESLRSSLDNQKDTIVSNFILIRLENGKQFLCSIYFDDQKGEYVIRSVQEVPLAMQNIFVAQ